jgi:hypothetical protein
VSIDSIIKEDFSFIFYKTIALDESGDIYIAIIGNLISAAVSNDVHIGIYSISSTGQLNWSKTLDIDAAFDHKLELLVSDDYIFLAGSYWGSIILYKDDNAINSDSNGGLDVFIICMTKTGDLKWLESFGGEYISNSSAGNAGEDIFAYACIDEYDNIYVTGTFSGELELDQPSGYFNYDAGDSPDLFLIKYNAEGLLLDAKFLSSEGRIEEIMKAFPFISDFKFENSNLYLSGRYKEELLINDDISLFPTANIQQINYILKLNTNLSPIWTLKNLELGEYKIEITDKNQIYAATISSENISKHNQINNSNQGKIYIINDGGEIEHEASWQIDDNLVWLYGIESDEHGNILFLGMSSPKSTTFNGYNNIFLYYNNLELDLGKHLTMNNIDDRFAADLAYESKQGFYFNIKPNSSITIPDTYQPNEAILQEGKNYIINIWFN